MVPSPQSPSSQPRFGAVVTIQRETRGETCRRDSVDRPIVHLAVGVRHRKVAVTLRRDESPTRGTTIKLGRVGEIGSLRFRHHQTRIRWQTIRSGLISAERDGHFADRNVQLLAKAPDSGLVSAQPLWLQAYEETPCVPRAVSRTTNVVGSA